MRSAVRRSLGEETFSGLNITIFELILHVASIFRRKTFTSTAQFETVINVDWFIDFRKLNGINKQRSKACASERLCKMI
jgi:hypothetical protein